MCARDSRVFVSSGGPPGRNLERDWEAAVADAGMARIWRLYIAASAVNFEDGNTRVHQVLAAKPGGRRSGMPLRPES
jgi:cyclopropane-fatty-acyl-phospholipid synthase